MEILIKRVHDNAKLPEYGREAGPGIDLYALSDMTLEPGEKMVVSTGVAMAIPVGYIGLIRSQHSNVISQSVKVTVDQIDSGYREEVSVELTNTGESSVSVAAGEQIAQLLILQTHRAHLIEAEDVSGMETAE